MRTTGKLVGHAIISARINVSDFIVCKYKDNEIINYETVNVTHSVRKENRTSIDGKISRVISIG